ncbi:MAG: hypothetical protein IJX28_08100 [Clostridia bacterium]|nr:hypothetical protein [Clostridia bacterium]
MKKRLVCLLLCLTMLLSLVLTACSGEDDDVEDKITTEASENAMTLTMWIVSEKKLSEETIDLVSSELSDITKSKFKTQLEITFLTKDVYESTVTQTILNYEKAKAEKDQIATEATTAPEGTGEAAVTDATETLESGMTIIKYPEAVPYQVDIIYIAGEDMYNDYIERGWLYSLDSELSGSSKKIKEYISGTLLSAAKINGSTYAVPNNNIIGEYKYMLLNKELMEKYSQQGYVTQGKIDGFFNTYLYSFLKQVHLFEKDVIPVDATYEDCLNLLAHYWSIDPTDYSMLQDFSVFGYHYTDIAALSRGSVILGYDSLFENADFTADYLKLNEFKFNNYFGDASGKKAAVKFVSGDSTVLDQYKDEYYSVVVEYPTASADDIYSNMFGVCIYSKSLSRSMEIVTYLNTNSEFRNLLQYGVLNKHYKLVTEEDGATNLVRLNEDYMMDIYATGNVFLAYPEPEMSADVWENGKVQNRGSLVNPLLGFDMASFATSGATTSSSVSLSKEGYNVSYTSGYSVDVLSQDETLSAWLASCKDTKGVHVLKTYATSGQYLTANYYIYNNDLSAATNFSVIPQPSFETQTDKDGNEKEVLKSVDFVLNYEDAAGSSKGYELSIFSLYTKKNLEYKLLCKANGAEKTISETENKAVIDFDFFNTKEYTIEVYEDLTKTGVLKNAALMEWIKTCDAGIGRNAQNFVLTFHDAATDVYTYVLYRTGMKNVTTLEILPTGDSGELKMAFNFTEDTDAALELSTTATENDRNYLLYYIRVTPNVKGLDISYTASNNGETESVAKTEAAADPNFVLCGNLDTELVKYLYRLNTEINDVINSCTTYADLELVVKELGVLLSTGKDVPTIGSFSKLKTMIQNGVIAGDLETLHKYVLSATSTEPVKELGLDNEELKWQDPTFKISEPYTYYDSPYGMYYSWMETYGFLPKK